jgi:flagellar protein FlgJ
MEAQALIDIGLSAYQANRVPPSLGKVDTAAQAAKTAEDFEAFFLGQMLQPMFNGLEAEAPFGGGHAEKIWRTMMVDEMGKAMAEAGGIGIADQVQREILRLQEAEQ